MNDLNDFELHLPMEIYDDDQQIYNKYQHFIPLVISIYKNRLMVYAMFSMLTMKSVFTRDWMKQKMKEMREDEILSLGVFNQHRKNKRIEFMSLKKLHKLMTKNIAINTTCYNLLKENVQELEKYIEDQMTLK